MTHTWYFQRATDKHFHKSDALLKLATTQLIFANTQLKLANTQLKSTILKHYGKHPLMHTF